MPEEIWPDDSRPESDHEELTRVAREIWRMRGPGSTGSAEEDWFKAKDIIQARRKHPRGNTSPPIESYLTDINEIRESNHYPQKEQTEVMDYNPGMGSSGSGSIGSGSSGESLTESVSNTLGNTVSNVKERVTGIKDRVGERVSEMVERQPKSMPNPQHREGYIARSIEQQTAKIPSDAWLWAAIGSIGLSLALELSGREKTATFVGHWAPTLLILGLYNKMVKLQGSDGL